MTQHSGCKLPCPISNHCRDAKQRMTVDTATCMIAGHLPIKTCNYSNSSALPEAANSSLFNRAQDEQVSALHCFHPLQQMMASMHHCSALCTLPLIYHWPIVAA
jgi:hypothetical protein